MKISITPEHLSFLEMGAVLTYYGSETKYYHFPFWIKECKGEFELFTSENLPKDLVQRLQKERVDDDSRIYYYKDKPYKILHKSRIKAEGFIIFLASLGVSQVGIEAIRDTKIDDWVDVVIYECLYENPQGQIWVREKEEFFEKFKPIT